MIVRCCNADDRERKRPVDEPREGENATWLYGMGMENAEWCVVSCEL